MSAETSAHGAAQSAAKQAKPQQPLIPPTDNPSLNVFADDLSNFAAPFQTLSDPEASTLERVNAAVGGTLGLIEAPVTLLNDGFALLTDKIAALFPALPAATLGQLHLGFPHVHPHPPAMPFPLPSVGAVALAGCASVLINGVPAARAGDMGIALGCGSVSPPFEVFTGSSKVFIGGSRAARMLDITRHCQPGGGASKAASGFAKVVKIAGHVMGVAGIAAGVLNAVTEEVKANKAEAKAGEEKDEEEARQARDEAEAGHKSAQMAGIQTGLDAAAMAMGLLMGLDPGAPPCIGAVLSGAPNVLIGGFPMPPWMDFAKGLGKLAKLKGKKPKKKHANHECESEGHPIDPVTGANFDHFVDYEDPESPLAFRWVRHYTSADAGRDGPMGRGFRHSYERSLAVDLDRAVYTDDKGRSVEILLPGPEQEETFREGYVLGIEDAGEAVTYTITRADEPAMEFVRKRSGRGVTRLARLRAGDARMDFLYDARGRLSGLIEVSGDAAVETRLVLDAEGHIVEVRRGPRGLSELPLIAAYAYGHAGCLTLWQDALGAKGSYAYDAGRRITRMTDRNGYSFHFRYDELGRCVEEHGDDGLWAVTMRYEPENRRTFATRANGGVWIHEYDENGTIVCVTDPYGGKQQRIVDDEGKVVREIGPDGQTNLTFLYDDDGYHYGVVDRFGYLHPPLDEEPNPPDPLELRVPGTAWEQQWGTALDALTELPASTLGVPATAWTTFARCLPREPEAISLRYDGLGRLIEASGASGQREAWVHDANGNEVLHRDRDGREHRIAVTSWNLIGAEIDPLGQRTTYEHTPHEFVVRVVDPRGDETRYAYDRKDRLVRVIHNGVVSDEYAYDVADRLIEKRDGSGAVLFRCAIGNGGLESERRLSSGEVYRFEHDARGRITLASRNDIEVRRGFWYDGRLAFDHRGGRGVQHRFDWTGPIATTYFDRFLVRLRREASGALAISPPVGGVTRIHRGERGSVIALLGNGTRVLSAYDDEGRCLGRTVFRLRGGALALWSARYTHSAEGELRLVEDSARGTTEHMYDAAHRLIGETDPSGRQIPIVLDPAGNVLEKRGLSRADVGEGNCLRAAGRERFRYDARGNLAEHTDETGATTRYRYDSEDMLVGVSWSDKDDAWTAAYDGLGRRLFKAIGPKRTDYYWDGDRLAAEIGPTGALRIYVYPDPESLVPLLFLDYAGIDADPASGRAHYLVTNPLGVPLHVEDGEGVVVWRAERVDPYGAVTVAPGASVSCSLRFPGHFFDEETGLHYNRFRYYSPRLGRYLQRDPIGQSGGVNLYAYPSNPLVDVDVLGLAPHYKKNAGASKGKGIAKAPFGAKSKPKLKKAATKLKKGKRDMLSDAHISFVHYANVDNYKIHVQKRTPYFFFTFGKVVKLYQKYDSTGPLPKLFTDHAAAQEATGRRGGTTPWDKDDAAHLMNTTVVPSRFSGFTLSAKHQTYLDDLYRASAATLNQPQFANVSSDKVIDSAQTRRMNQMLGELNNGATLDRVFVDKHVGEMLDELHAELGKAKATGKEKDQAYEAALDEVKYMKDNRDDVVNRVWEEIAAFVSFL